MSDNGPHMQPPHPGPGGDPNNPSGPYGTPYGQPGPPPGDPQYGGQPHYPSGPYAGGGEVYGSGPQPGHGPQFQQPHDQGMFQGGQPPYGPGGPGGPEMPGYPQPQKSNAGLFIVLGGGVVILALIVVVVVMLFRTGGDESTEVAAPPPTDDTEAPPEDATEEEPDTKDDEPVETEVGEPPHALPEDQCAGLPEDQLAELEASQDRTSTTDNTSLCVWEVTVGEGETGTLEVQYMLPYSASDSVEAATSDYERELEWATDEDSDFMDRTVHENNEVELGDEANLIFATRESSGLGDVSEATMMVRQDNMIVTVSLSVYPNWIDGEEDAPLEYSDVSDMMPDLGASAVNNVG